MLKRVAQRSAGSSNGPTRDDLLGQVCVFEVISDKMISTKRGDTDALSCKVLAVTGDHAGQVNDDLLAFGNLRKGLLKEIGVGSAGVVRVVAGDEKPDGSRAWWGVNGVTDEEAQAGAAAWVEAGFEA